MTTTAWAAKSPAHINQEGQIDLETISHRHDLALDALVKVESCGGAWNYETVKRDLLSAGWRIVKVKIEEVE